MKRAEGHISAAELPSAVPVSMAPLQSGHSALAGRGSCGLTSTEWTAVATCPSAGAPAMGRGTNTYPQGTTTPRAKEVAAKLLYVLAHSQIDHIPSSPPQLGG